MAKFQPRDFSFLWDNVLITPLKPDQKGSFKVPRGEEDKPEIGIVVRVGWGIENDLIQEGDTVMFNKYSTTKTDFAEDLVVRAEDIIAVLIKNKNEKRKK